MAMFFKTHSAYVWCNHEVNLCASTHSEKENSSHGLKSTMSCHIYLSNYALAMDAYFKGHENLLD